MSLGKRGAAPWSLPNALCDSVCPERAVNQSTFRSPAIWAVLRALMNSRYALRMAKSPLSAERTRVRASIITDADRSAAERLRQYWELRTKRGDQTILATQWHGANGAGITQGAVSQYIHGHTALNAAAVLRFAEFLGIDPLNIRDDLPELHHIARARAGDLLEEQPRSAAEMDERVLDARWNSYSRTLKAEIVRMVECARAPERHKEPELHGGRMRREKGARNRHIAAKAEDSRRR